VVRLVLDKLEYPSTVIQRRLCCWLLLQPEQAFHLSDHEIDHFVVVLLEFEFLTNDLEGLTDDAEEHALHSEDHKPRIEEVEDWTEDRLSRLHFAETRFSEDEAEEDLDRISEGGIVLNLSAEEQVAELSEGKEVDEEGNDEGLQVLTRRFDGLRQHR